MTFVQIEPLLLQHRAAIIRRCIGALLEAYPPETSQFLVREKDRFANPVGYAITHGMETLFDELVGSMDAGRVRGCLDDIIRIRAAQGCSPATAVSFVFVLRDVVRGELGLNDPSSMRLDRETLLPGLLEFEHRINRVAATALDIYVRCREQIYELKLRERKSGIPGRRRKSRKG